MGLGLGLGLLVGVRAATAGMTVVLLLVAVGFMILAVASPETMRPAFVCLAAGCLFGWTGAALRMEDPADATFTALSTPIAGTVTSDPRTSAGGTQALVVWHDERHVRHDVLVFWPAGTNIGRGDQVVVNGQLSREGNIPAIFATSTIVSREATRLELARRSVRDYSTRQMVTNVPGSPGSLVLGLLIGDDAGLSAFERADLRMSGLSHITAVSGWNVSVAVATTGALFRAFGARRWRWLIVQLVLLAGYVWIVGLEPPIQRAAIMGAIALVALQLGRPAHMLTLLTITAGAMAAWNPAILYSLSFMLSFLAMIGLAVAARMSAGFAGWRSVLMIPATSAGLAGIATAPLLAATFGTVSWMTVPANVIAAPLVPLATFTGMFVVATSWIAPLADPLGWIAWIISSGLLWISQLFAGVPRGHMTFAPLEASTVFTIYFGLALVAAPCLPEGRALARRLDRWFRSTPAAAMVASFVAIGVLLIGVLAA